MNIVTMIEIIDPVSTPHNSVFLNEKFNLPACAMRCDVANRC